MVTVTVGVAPWRERWIARRRRRPCRVRGVWDASLVRETIVLRDGRKLTYFLDGPTVTTTGSNSKQRLPHIFVLHAMFLSGNVFLMQEPPTEYVLVAINRPGYFGSDPPLSKEYNYETFAKDMGELADRLMLDRFYVAGHSSGGPCSLACAAHLPNRVAAVGLLSSDPEYAHELAPNKHWVNDFFIGKVLPCLCDYLLCCLPFARMASPGLRNDYRLETALYSFETESIEQPVLIHVGEQDVVLPPDISRHLHDRLSNATLRTIPHVGHMSLLRDDVLLDFFESLVSIAPPQLYDLGFEAVMDTVPQKIAVLEESPLLMEPTATTTPTPVQVPMVNRNENGVTTNHLHIT